MSFVTQMGLIDEATGKLLTASLPDAQPSRFLDRLVAPDGATLVVTLHCSEFTCRCPMTDQPDWAHIDITYEPGPWLVESKSFKLYLETWRDKGIFHEYLAQQILNDFVEQIEPLTCEVTANFNTRGGIAISATAQYYDCSGGGQ